MKQCGRCSIEFSDIKKNFHTRKDSLDGYTGICKHCLSKKKKRKYEHIKDKLLLCLICSNYKDEEEFDVSSDKVYRKCRDSRCKTCKKLQKEKRRISSRGNGSLERLLMERFCGVRDRAIKAGLSLDFDKSYLEELWTKQEGSCAISGINMTHIIFSGRVPTNVSVDRIDCNEGYIKKNVQLVCMAVNQMKSDLSYEQLLTFCEAIIENSSHWKK